MTETERGDPIRRLAAAGLLNPRRALSEAERDVLAGLSAAEVETLVALQQRLAQAAEVVGHGAATAGDGDEGPILGAV